MEDSKSSLFDVALYLVSSARDCMEEPLIYGPLRLIVAVEKIISLCESKEEFRDEFLIGLKDKLSRTVLLSMSNREEFVRAIDELLVDFSRELKKRTLNQRS